MQAATDPELSRLEGKLQAAKCINDRRRIDHYSKRIAARNRQLQRLLQLSLFEPPPRSPVARQAAEARQIEGTRLSLMLAATTGYWFCNECERVIEDIDPDTRRCPVCKTFRIVHCHGCP